jgi:hypothetical protein
MKTAQAAEKYAEMKARENRLLCIMKRDGNK